MVIDTSAIIAILAMEPEAEAFAAVLAADDHRLISAGTMQELRIVAAVKFGTDNVGELELLVHELDATIVPVTAELAELGYRAWLRWGRSRHPAALNYGDCFAVALALQTGEPLLFKGADFAHPDVAEVIRSAT